MGSIVELIKNLPPELATFLLAMLPLTELRGSIPFAIAVFNMSPYLAFLLSILGDIVPAILIILFLKPIAVWLSQRFTFFDKVFSWWFKKIEKNFSKKYETYGALALMIFVAIPLPVTGAWTGATASFLFDIPKKTSIIFISLGVIIAGILVTLISTGVINSIN